MLGKVIGFMTFSIIILSCPSWATTYYVSSTTLNGYGLGNDTNTCTQAQSKSTPKLTLDKTASSGIRCLAASDTLVVNQGNYDDDPILNPPGGTSSSYTIIMAEPSASSKPLLRPNQANPANLLRGFTCNLGSACSYILFQGFEVYRAYNSVNLVPSGSTYAHDIVFKFNKFCHTQHTNVLPGDPTSGPPQGGPFNFFSNEFCNTGEFYTDTGNTNPYPVRHNTIYGVGNNSFIQDNYFHDLANGIGIWGSGTTQTNLTASNNVFARIGREDLNAWLAGPGGTYAAIHISVPGGGHKIYNNVIYDSCYNASNTSNKCVPIHNGWTGYGDLGVIYNNTIYNLLDTNTNCIGVYDPGGSTSFPTLQVINNLCWQAQDLYRCSSCPGTSSNNLTSTNPLFVNQSSDNLSLLDGSPAINAGANVGLPYNGASPDIGAYDSFYAITSSATSNIVEVIVSIAENTPLIPSVSGWTVTCTGTGCGSMTVISASLKPSTTNVIHLTVPSNYQAGQTWKVSYNSTLGNTTDSMMSNIPASIPNQNLSSFSNMTVQATSPPNVCTN